MKNDAVAMLSERSCAERNEEPMFRRPETRPDPDVCIKRGLTFLRQRQFPSGEFSTLTWFGDDIENNSRYDGSLFATTFILYSLAFIADADVAEMRNKGLDFLERETLPSGLWRFWTKQSPNVKKMPYGIPPDIDDTCCVSFLLRKYRTAPDNLTLLLSARNRQGRFYTWMLPRLSQLRVSPGFCLKGIGEIPVQSLMWAKTEAAPNDVDCCVNANVLFYLGRRPETEAAAHFVEESVRIGQGTVADKWYDGIPCFYLLSRAHFVDSSVLRTVKNQIIRALEKRLTDIGADITPLEAALSVCTFLNFGYDAPVTGRLIQLLVETQQSEGEWPAGPFHYGGPSHIRSYGSAELTTAICLEALSRFCDNGGADAII